MMSKTGTTVHMYQGDTEVQGTPSTNTSGDVGVNSATVWGFMGSPTGAQKTPADLSDVWFDDAALDFSSEAVRRNFIDADGKPVDLGTDGSTPTGAAPLIYFRRVPGESAASYAVNKGSAQDFVVNGTLTDSAQGSPTD